MTKEEHVSSDTQQPSQNESPHETEEAKRQKVLREIANLYTQHPGGAAEIEKLAREAQEILDKDKPKTS